MPYQRGTGSVELELSRVQSCLEDLEPDVTTLKQEVAKIKLDMASYEGSLRVIIWLNLVIIGLLSSLIITLFAWGLNHITIRAAVTQSELHAPAEAGNPPF
jgi:hypothetical protein